MHNILPELNWLAQKTPEKNGLAIGLIISENKNDKSGKNYFSNNVDSRLKVKQMIMPVTIYNTYIGST